MYNKLSTLLVLVLAAGSLGGCAKKAKDLGPPAGWVECGGNKDGFQCVLEHKGGPKILACWTVQVICKNGTIMEVKDCAAADIGKKTELCIPYEKLSNFNNCNGVAQRPQVILRGVVSYAEAEAYKNKDK